MAIKATIVVVAPSLILVGLTLPVDRIRKDRLKVLLVPRFNNAVATVGDRTLKIPEDFRGFGKS